MMRVGCSGFYYPQWKNKFYPKGLSPKDWLCYYSSVFNTVELNGTFYRMPKASDLIRYREVTPANFTFTVKMSRYVTHIKRLSDPSSITGFQTLIRDNLGQKLQHFLFQLPSTYRFTDENLDRILSNIPNHSHNVVEFRHVSWWNEKKSHTALQAAGIVFCNVDYPGLKSHIVDTSPAFYLRMHGTPVLFSSNYNVSKLKRFNNEIPGTAIDINVYFNNTMNESGFKNAAQFMSIANVRG